MVLGLGMMKGVEVSINVVEVAKTHVPVPYSFKDKTEIELKTTCEQKQNPA